MTTEDHSTSAVIDTSKPHSARVYDYFLGGKNHYEADRQAGEDIIAFFPDIKTCAQVNRSFMHRATRWLVREAGIRQFLDIGTGIPTEPNLHQEAQRLAPDTRVLYADNDPVVLAYAQALLVSTSEGRTEYLHADFRNPERILASEELRDTLDLTRPVALSLNALLHFVPDEDGPYEIVRRLVDALPSGSYLALSHVTADFEQENWGKVVEIYRQRGIPLQMRDRDETLSFFTGLDLVEPGLVVQHRWRPDPGGSLNTLTDAEVSLYAGVARKP